MEQHAQPLAIESFIIIITVIIVIAILSSLLAGAIHSFKIIMRRRKRKQFINFIKEKNITLQGIEVLASENGIPSLIRYTETKEIKDEKKEDAFKFKDKKFSFVNVFRGSKDIGSKDSILDEKSSKKNSNGTVTNTYVTFVR